ncbi:MAG: hypothetical protein ABEH66_06765, partial [Halobacteriales archaeon]
MDKYGPERSGDRNAGTIRGRDTGWNRDRSRGRRPERITASLGNPTAMPGDGDARPGGEHVYDALRAGGVDLLV